jgi:hypothetical protein
MKAAGLKRVHLPGKLSDSGGAIVIIFYRACHPIVGGGALWVSVLCVCLIRVNLRAHHSAFIRCIRCASQGICGNTDQPTGGISYGQYATDELPGTKSEIALRSRRVADNDVSASIAQNFGGTTIFAHDGLRIIP